MSEPRDVRVLLMEDDPGLARLFQKRLGRHGYQIEWARDGAEGLAMYDAGCYDIVVMDQVMPGYTGLEVIRILAARGPLPPIIMVTGTGSEQIAVEAMKLGASDYIVKDVDGGYFELLPSVIEQALQQYRLREEKRRVEAALQELNADLERQVNDRTAQLQATIHSLKTEIAERQRVEAALRRAEESLAQRLADQSRKLAALYEVILVGDPTLDVENLLEKALTKITAVLGSDAGCVHLHDENDFTLRLAAHQGLTRAAQTEVMTLPADALPGESIPQMVSDLAADRSLPGPLRGLGFHAYLGGSVLLHGQVIGALSLFWMHHNSLSVEDIALFRAMADQLSVLIENVRLRRRIEETAILKERRRLARDLHDSVTQSLHSLVLSADTSSLLLSQQRFERLAHALSQLGESARQALKEMRFLLYELRLAPLEQVSLVEVLQTRLEAIEQRAGVEARLVVEGQASWPKAWEAELYAISMEALNNALKHARASEVVVSLHSSAADVELEVADNGQGFDPRAHRGGGMGLRTMAERAERLGGELAVESAPGSGTRIRFRASIYQIGSPTILEEDSP